MRTARSGISAGQSRLCSNVRCALCRTFPSSCCMRAVMPGTGLLGSCCAAWEAICWSRCNVESAVLSMLEAAVALRHQSLIAPVSHRNLLVLAPEAPQLSISMLEVIIAAFICHESSCLTRGTVTISRSLLAVLTWVSLHPSSKSTLMWLIAECGRRADLTDLACGLHPKLVPYHQDDRQAVSCSSTTSHYKNLAVLPAGISHHAEWMISKLHAQCGFYATYLLSWQSLCWGC